MSARSLVRTCTRPLVPAASAENVHFPVWPELTLGRHSGLACIHEDYVLGVDDQCGKNGTAFSLERRIYRHLSGASIMTEVFVPWVLADHLIGERTGGARTSRRLAMLIATEI